MQNVITMRHTMRDYFFMANSLKLIFILTDNES